MKQQLNILHLFKSYPLFYQPYLASLLDALHQEEEISQVVASFETIQSDQSQYQVLDIPQPKLRKLKEFLFSLSYFQYPKLDYLAYACLSKSIDVLHVQHSFLNFKILKVLELPSEVKPKIVITLRGDDTYLKPWISKKWKLFYKEYAQKIDAFVVMSEHQKNYLQKWGVEAANIHVIPISLADSETPEPKSLNSNSRTIKVCSAFRYSWEKNIESALRTVKSIRDQGYQVEYKIYGGGSYNPAIQLHYFIDKYELNNEVVICGEVENETLKKELRKSDFYLQLSHSESLGMAVIEAQSIGLPAIVSTSGGLPEVIRHGETGFCVESWDASTAASRILELWQDPKQYAQFSKEGISFSRQKFNVEKEKQSLIDLYKQLNLN